MSLRPANDVKLILWRDNTVGKYTTWSFIETNESFILRRVIWNQYTAYSRVNPETYCADVIISKKLFTKLTVSLLKIISDDTPEIPNMIVIDGTTYGIIVNGRKLQWYNCSQAPKTLNTAFENTITELETMFF